MAVRAHRRSKSARILMPATVNPTWRRVAGVITEGQGLKLETLPYDPATGCIDVKSLAQFEGGDITALVIQQPNFFGQLEDVDALTRWARTQGALVIAAVNPVALALVAPPGDWGDGGRRHRRAAMPSPAACRCRPADPTSGSWPAAWSTCARCPGASRAAPWTPRASPASR